MERLNKIKVKRPNKSKKKPRPAKSSLKGLSLRLDSYMDSKSRQSKHQSRQATNVGSLPVSSMKIYMVALARPWVCQLLIMLAIPYHLTHPFSQQQIHQAVPIINQLLFSLFQTALEV